MADESSWPSFGDMVGAGATVFPIVRAGLAHAFGDPVRQEADVTPEQSTSDVDVHAQLVEQVKMLQALEVQRQISQSSNRSTSASPIHIYQSNPISVPYQTYPAQAACSGGQAVSAGVPYSQSTTLSTPRQPHYNTSIQPYNTSIQPARQQHRPPVCCTSIQTARHEQQQLPLQRVLDSEMTRTRDGISTSTTLAQILELQDQRMIAQQAQLDAIVHHCNDTVAAFSRRDRVVQAQVTRTQEHVEKLQRSSDDDRAALNAWQSTWQENQDQASQKMKESQDTLKETQDTLKETQDTLQRLASSQLEEKKEASQTRKETQDALQLLASSQLEEKKEASQKMKETQDTLQQLADLMKVGILQNAQCSQNQSNAPDSQEQQTATNLPTFSPKGPARALAPDRSS